jgi:hypothetical protein
MGFGKCQQSYSANRQVNDQVLLGLVLIDAGANVSNSASRQLVQRFSNSAIAEIGDVIGRRNRHRGLSQPQLVESRRIERYPAVTGPLGTCRQGGI